MTSRKIIFHLLLVVVTLLVIGGVNESLCGESIVASINRQLMTTRDEILPTQLRFSLLQNLSGNQSTLKEYKIPPKATDSTIDNWLEPHYVAINKSIPLKDKLFVFFSGSRDEPIRQRLIIKQAAIRGYHAINLRYPNSWTVGSLCQHSTDVNCAQKVRLEILDGVDRADEIKISRSNCIENRLSKLLLYLHRQHPEQGWLAYLDGNSLKWGSLIVAGHSQGGGHAAMVAKEHVVARVVMFGAPTDVSAVLNAPAPWLTKAHATPAERYYGFTHVKDQWFDRIQQAWKLLGLATYGAIVNVDGLHPPYRRSHQLTTAEPPDPSFKSKYHWSVVIDEATPKLPDGTPMFKQVWQYLLGVLDIVVPLPLFIHADLRTQFTTMFVAR